VACFDETYHILGAKIVYYRRLRNMTQEELAEKASISRARLSDIERGKSSISLDTLLFIGRALQVELTQLLCEDL